VGGSITFPSTLQGPAGQLINSDTFGTLSAGKSYAVDLLIFGTNTLSYDTIPLRFEVFGVTDNPTISNVQWSFTSAQSYRTNVVGIEYVVAAKFIVNGSATLTDYSLKVRITAGVSTSSADKAVTLQGNYRAQLVGSTN
jgi:hypothetical protein